MTAAIVLSVVNFCLSIASLISALHLKKYIHDKFLQLVAKTILLFNFFFFLILIPYMFTEYANIFVTYIPSVLVLVIFISVGEVVFLKFFHKKNQAKVQDELWQDSKDDKNVNVD
jgi:hypothetical protein